MLSQLDLKGYAALFGFSLVTAYYAVALHNVSQHVNPIVIAFTTFALCLLFFNIANFQQLRATYIAATQDKNTVLIINIATAINWLATVWSLKHISPVLFVAIYLGLIPIITLLISIVHKQPVKLLEVLTGVGILLMIMLFTFNQQPVEALTDFYLHGVFYAILASCCGSMYLVYSKKLNAHLNFSAVQTLSLRFFFLIAAALGLAIYQLGLTGFLTELGKISFTQIMVLTLATSILPQFLLQLGINILGPLPSAYFLPITLVLVYLLELTYKLSIFNLEVCIGLFILMTLMMLLNHLRFKACR